MLNLSVAYPDTMENFNRLLARYGVTVHRGSMIETDSEYYYRYPNLILPDIGEHDVTEGLSKTDVQQLWSVGFTVEEDRNRSTEITPILTTSDSAIIKADPASETMDVEEGDEQGQFYTGLMIEDTTSVDGDLKNTRIAVFGSAYMFDYENGFLTNGNYTLLHNTLNYLQTAVDTLYIEPKEYVTDTLSINASTMVTLSATFVIVIPLALIIAGIIVWSRRKRL